MTRSIVAAPTSDSAAAPGGLRTRLGIIGEIFKCQRVNRVVWCTYLLRVRRCALLPSPETPSLSYDLLVRTWKVIFRIADIVLQPPCTYASMNRFLVSQQDLALVSDLNAMRSFAARRTGCSSALLTLNLCYPCLNLHFAPFLSLTACNYPPGIHS